MQELSGQHFLLMILTPFLYIFFSGVDKCDLIGYICYGGKNEQHKVLL